MWFLFLPVYAAGLHPQRRHICPRSRLSEEAFIHELSDIYSAEKQMTKALPKLAKASTNPQLAEGFTLHLEETQGQIERMTRSSTNWASS